MHYDVHGVPVNFGITVYAKVESITGAGQFGNQRLREFRGNVEISFAIRAYGC